MTIPPPSKHQHQHQNKTTDEPMPMVHRTTKQKQAEAQPRPTATLLSRRSQEQEQEQRLGGTHRSADRGFRKSRNRGTWKKASARRLQQEQELQRVRHGMLANTPPPIRGRPNNKHREQAAQPGPVGVRELSRATRQKGFQRALPCSNRAKEPQKAPPSGKTQQLASTGDQGPQQELPLQFGKMPAHTI